MPPLIQLYDFTLLPANVVEVIVDLFASIWHNSSDVPIIVKVDYTSQTIPTTEMFSIWKSTWTELPGGAPNAQRVKNPGGSITLNDPPDQGSQMTVTVEVGESSSRTKTVALTTAASPTPTGPQPNP